MRIFLQKAILIVLLFSFSALVLKMNLRLFSDLNEELLEEILDTDEKDSSDESDEMKIYHFQSDNNFTRNANPSFYVFNSSLLKKVCSFKYCEPNLDNPFSPPELIS